jgi:hypothetical protein
MERLGGVLRWLLTPELVDQAVTRDDLVGVDEQDPEQGTLLRAAYRERVVPIDDLDRPEDSKLHGASWAPDRSTAAPGLQATP